MPRSVDAPPTYLPSSLPIYLSTHLPNQSKITYPYPNHPPKPKNKPNYTFFTYITNRAPSRRPHRRRSAASARNQRRPEHNGNTKQGEEGGNQARGSGAVREEDAEARRDGGGV